MREGEWITYLFKLLRDETVKINEENYKKKVNMDTLLEGVKQKGRDLSKRKWIKAAVFEQSDWSKGSNQVF